jgi:hypothetical protein
MKTEENKQGAPRAADPKLRDDAKPGTPKTAHRDLVDSGKHENKDTRREVREKHTQ